MNQYGNIGYKDAQFISMCICVQKGKCLSFTVTFSVFKHFQKLSL
ncbi:hypothetical protein X975_07431, partial [Stegodyphus mimosarum]